MTSAKRGGRTGRPRLVEPTEIIDPVEHILREGGRLFTEQGYTSTTTTQIAAAAGLRQGSLYHYFASKLDILATLLERTIVRAVTVAAWVHERDATAAGKLWALGYFDVASMCSGPYKIGVLVRLPEARLPRFGEFWAEAVRLHAAYEALLVEGRHEGDFDFSDSGLTAAFLFGIADGPAYWFDEAIHDRDDVAAITARAMLLAVLAEPDTLARHIAEGRDLVSAAPREWIGA